MGAVHAVWRLGGLAACGWLCFVSVGQTQDFCLPPKQDDALCVPQKNAPPPSPSSPAPPLVSAPSVASVSAIDGAEAAARGAHTLDEALHLLPGMHAASHGGLGSVRALSLRGSAAGQFAVLLDGMPLADASSVNHTAPLHTALAHDVERLALVRGSQAVLYGSGALGGAVNLVSRAPPQEDGTEADVRAGYGSYRTSQAAGALAQTRGALGWRMSAAHVNREGHSRILAGEERDGTELYQWRGRVRLRPSDEMQGDFFGFYAGSDSNYDPSLSEDGKAQEKSDAWRVQTRLGWQGFGAAHTLSAGFAARQRRLSSQGLFPLRSALDARSSHLRYQWARDFMRKRLNFIAGGEWRHDEWEAERLARTDYGGGFLHLTFRPRPAWQFVLGGRAEGHAQTGAVFVWQAGLAHAWGDWGLSWRANYGTAFKAPSLYQLYAPPFMTEGGAALPIGNAQLRPERGEHWDIGLVQRLWDGRVMVDASWFWFQTRDQIGFDGASGYQNIARARRQGLELQAQWRPLARLLLAATYVYTEARDLRAHRPQPRVPRHAGTLRAAWEGERLNLAADWRYVGRQWDRADGSRQTPAYHVWDMNLRWQTRAPLALELQLRNLLDRRYQSVWGYREPGFDLFASVSANF